VDGGAPQPLLTVLTTNHAGKIRPELYRSGRIDKHFTFGLLQLQAAADLADTVRDSFGISPLGGWRNQFTKRGLKAPYSHADVTNGARLREGSQGEGVALMGAQAFEMMKGSEKHMDYVVLARRGRFKIGLKVVGVAHTKIAGKSYVAIRIRSAYDEGYEPPKVPNLALEKLALESAWPGVKFENVNDERASTNGGVFINGDFQGEILYHRRPGCRCLLRCPRTNAGARMSGSPCAV